MNDIPDSLELTKREYYSIQMMKAWRVILKGGVRSSEVAQRSLLDADALIEEHNRTKGENP